jgi:hypothetical protein
MQKGKPVDLLFGIEAAERLIEGPSSPSPCVELGSNEELAACRQRFPDASPLSSSRIGHRNRASGYDTTL